jgi:hypothetical protein
MGMSLLGCEIAGFRPAGDDFFQFVTEAIDDFSYQNILSVEMANYDGFTDGWSGTMACVGRMQKVFRGRTIEKIYLARPLEKLFRARAG